MDVTTILLAAARAGVRGAYDLVFARVYDELRRVASRQAARLGANESLSTTVLVHEAYLKLAGTVSAGGAGHDRVHFFALAARAMRQFLIDHARHRGRRKRGGGVRPAEADAVALPAAPDALPVEDSSRSTAPSSGSPRSIPSWCASSSGASSPASRSRRSPATRASPSGRSSATGRWRGRSCSGARGRRGMTRSHRSSGGDPPPRGRARRSLDGAAREARLAGVAPGRRRGAGASRGRRRRASHRLEAAVGHGAADWLAAQRAAAPEPGAGGDLAGSRLGVWRLERPLGRGGMAEVWAASRADGEYRQEVAVKLLKRGMDSDEIVARFRRERQILAQLVHPAIARLLDGGVAPDGRPYFVLERVDGEPITQWCAAHGAELRRVFLLEVAAAVAAAHRQLVVHRPEARQHPRHPAGRVKLLDFGIAKLLAPDAGEATDATRTGVPPPGLRRARAAARRAGLDRHRRHALGVLAYEPSPPAAASAARGATRRRSPRPTSRRSAPVDGGAHGDGGRIRRRMADPRPAPPRPGALPAISTRSCSWRPAAAGAAVRLGGGVRRRPAQLAQERPIAARPDSVGYRFRSFVRGTASA